MVTTGHLDPFCLLGFKISHGEIPARGEVQRGRATQETEVSLSFIDWRRVPEDVLRRNVKPPRVFLVTVDDRSVFSYEDGGLARNTSKQLLIEHD